VLDAFFAFCLIGIVEYTIGAVVLFEDLVVRCKMQGWWSRLNFYSSGSCSGARFSKLFSSDSGSGAGHFPFMASTPARFDLNFAGSGSAPASLHLRSKLKFAISH